MHRIDVPFYPVRLIISDLEVVALFKIIFIVTNGNGGTGPLPDESYEQYVTNNTLYRFRLSSSSPVDGI